MLVKNLINKLNKKYPNGNTDIHMNEIEDIFVEETMGLMFFHEPDLPLSEPDTEQVKEWRAAGRANKKKEK